MKAEITAAMLEAGLDAYDAWEEADAHLPTPQRTVRLVTALYGAMHQASDAQGPSTSPETAKADPKDDR